MRLPFPFLVLFAAALVSGCSHLNSGSPVVLQRVGPAPNAADQPRGSLLVYSALKVEMPDGSLAFEDLHHTDYKILSEASQFLQSVHNDYDNTWHGPKEVELPPGKYRIVATAAKYGIVTVPVLIAPHQLTRVNLMGTPLDSENELTPPANLVRLPNGEVVGYVSADKQDPEGPAQTSFVKGSQ